MAGKILMTGATGFLGKVIISELSGQGYEVLTVGKRDTDTFKANLAHGNFKLPYSRNIDIVIHAAGKAHSVPRTEEEEKEFFDVNFEGTRNFCNALIATGIKPTGFVFISTVAVYGLDEGEAVTEDAPLQGDTPYAKSKILAERWLQDWAGCNNIKLAILRLPLVAGPNPPGNLGAMIKAIKSGKYLSIGNASAKKSVVWAGDVAKVIPIIAFKGGTYNLTDGYDPSFGELEKAMIAALKANRVKKVPYWLARLFALVGDLLGRRAPINSDKLRKITSTLTFDSCKALTLLNWQPKRVLDKIQEMI
jgi:nucleoside-diphosphate-sugar epimerase